MHTTTRTTRADAPRRRRRRLTALAVALAATSLLAACGGDDDDNEAVPTTVGGPTTSSGPAGALPNLCELITAEEMAEATGKEVGTHYAVQNQCIYMAPDEKTLVGSVQAHRPGFIDFDDLLNTRGAEKGDEIDGHPTVFHPRFVITAGLKGDKYVAVQLAAGTELEDEDIERITREVLEIAVARA